MSCFLCAAPAAENLKIRITGATMLSPMPVRTAAQKLWLLDKEGNEISSDDPVLDIIEILSNGQIAAIKRSWRFSPVC